MICPTCQSENPDSNRFCGNCGNRLTDTQASSAEVSDPGKTTNPTTRRPFIVSTTAMTEAASRSLHSRVMPAPSIASSTSYGSPLRAAADPVYHGEQVSETPVAPVDPSDEPLFTQPEAVEEAPAHEQNEVREEETTPVYDTPRAGSILGLTAPIVTNRHDRFAEESVPETNDRFSDEYETTSTTHEAQVDEPTDAPPHNPFLQFDEPSSPSTRNVSGPSFLGLGAPEVEYLDEEQKTSHARAYLFLFVLVIVGVLGALEWRASQNGDSTNPMDVLHLKLPKKKGQGEVVVVPPSSNAPASPAADTNHASSDANNNGKPDLVAEPNRPAVQKEPAPTETNLPPQTGQGARPSTQQPTPAPATAETSPAPKPEEPASTNAAPAPSEKPAQSATEIATATPPTKPVAKPVPEPAKPASVKPRAATKTARPAPAAPPAEDAGLNAGAFELQKGMAAGDNEVGRMWLWKALSKGNGQAPVLLAEMYAQGRGVPKNCDQAMLILNAAAKKPNVRARSKLGSMYATGECVPMDRVKAYKWMSSALEVNPGSEWITRNRQDLLSKMSASERMRATR